MSAKFFFIGFHSSLALKKLLYPQKWKWKANFSLLEKRHFLFCMFFLSQLKAYEKKRWVLFKTKAPVLAICNTSNGDKKKLYSIVTIGFSTPLLFIIIFFDKINIWHSKWKVTNKFDFLHRRMLLLNMFGFEIKLGFFLFDNLQIKK